MSTLTADQEKIRELIIRTFPNAQALDDVVRMQRLTDAFTTTNPER
jgi:hypothetical protein